jgi:16S rRNA (guanine(966)-N(2))-methyltransferase RsmD
MRIIAGEFGGRKLKSLSGNNTRPTTDKIKGSIFNMIGPYFDGGLVHELFAGSGGLGIEAVSRGAEKAFLIDRNFGAIQIIKENVAITKAQEQFEVLKLDAKKALAKFQAEGTVFDYVFLDPPYARQEIVDLIEKMQEIGILSKDALIICEAEKTVDLPEEIGEFFQYKRQVYGITQVVIYERKAADE